MSRTPQQFHQLAEEAADNAAECLPPLQEGAELSTTDMVALAYQAQRALAFAALSQAYAGLAWSPGLEFGDEVAPR